jgi:hypothetical protein
MTPTYDTIIDYARLAPSVHNTQPWLWQITNTGLELYVNPIRKLLIGDKEGTDLALSMGMALDATHKVAEALGWQSTQTLHPVDWKNIHTVPHPVLLAQLHLSPSVPGTNHLEAIQHRRTCRTGFTPPSAQDKANAKTCIAPFPFTWIDSETDYGWCIDKGDKASLILMRDSTYRRELLSWMRLTQTTHAQDGMTAAALGLGPVMARLAKVALDQGFKPLDNIGLTPMLFSEKTMSKHACGIALLTAPEDHNPVQVGQLWFSYWLALHQHGLAGWPMASLVDDPKTKEAIQARFGITTPLWGAMRVGRPNNFPASPVRLSAPILPLTSAFEPQ